MFSSSASIQLHPHPLLRRTIVFKSSTKTHHSREGGGGWGWEEKFFSVFLHEQKSVKKLLCYAPEEKPERSLQ